MRLDYIAIIILQYNAIILFCSEEQHFEEKMSDLTVSSKVNEMFVSIRTLFNYTEYNVCTKSRLVYIHVASECPFIGIILFYYCNIAIMYSPLALTCTATDREAGPI